MREYMNVETTGAMEVQAENPRWVAEQTARLSEAVEVLDKTLESLTARLAPILSPDTPHAMTGDKIDSPSRSPLADELATKVERLFAQIERVQRLEGRLEI